MLPGGRRPSKQNSVRAAVLRVVDWPEAQMDCRAGLRPGWEAGPARRKPGYPIEQDRDRQQGLAKSLSPVFFLTLV